MDVTNTLEPLKSSAEILTELFSSFNAEPPNLDETPPKKHKKSKKKHKHKVKKHKRKSKYRYSTSDSTDASSDHSGVSKRKLKKRHKDYEYLNQITNLNLESIKREPSDEDDTTYQTSNTSLLFKINDLHNFIKKERDEDKVNVGNVAEKKETSSSKESIQIESTTKNIENTSQEKHGKITIKNLKNSSVYEAAVKEAEEKAARFEEGELTGSDNDNYDSLDNLTPDTTPRQHSSSSTSKHKSDYSNRGKLEESDESRRSRKSKHRSRTKERIHRSKKKHSYFSHSYNYSRDVDRDKYKVKDYERSRSRDRDKYKVKEYDRRRSLSNTKESNKRYSRSRSTEHDKQQSKYSDLTRDRSRSRDHNHRSKSRRRSKSREHEKRRSRSRSSRDRLERKRRSKSPTNVIDKKKLLEIARKNAINMLKSGTLPEALTLGPQAQEKVIAAIKSGGKTIEELTEFCRNLSKKEALGELSSVSSNEDDADSNTESSQPFHHPFQLKEKPLSIVMNIKNSTPLTVKNSKEKSAELRLQFPVSSGQQHRKTENEWVPVSPKSNENTSTPVVQPVVPAPLSVVAPPAPPPPSVSFIETPVQPSVSNVLQSQPTEVDISAIVSQRLSAMRRLQENPHDSYAMSQISESSKQMQTWAQSKMQPGQFTGSTGAHILSPAELSSGYQAWAKKDQLQTAAPVTGGMGMHLLQKMGWKPGEGLGKEKTGSLEPLLLEVKLDKKGLVANEEIKGKRQNKPQKVGTVKTLSGKHPVSLLGEYATKRKLGVPQYDLCFECGPDHKKNFLFKVTLNGVEYKANVASSTKKQAKADAATVCLQQLGLLL